MLLVTNGDGYPELILGSAYKNVFVLFWFFNALYAKATCWAYIIYLYNYMIYIYIYYTTVQFPAPSHQDLLEKYKVEKDVDDLIAVKAWITKTWTFSKCISSKMIHTRWVKAKWRTIQTSLWGRCLGVQFILSSHGFSTSISIFSGHKLQIQLEISIGCDPKSKEYNLGILEWT